MQQLPQRSPRALLILAGLAVVRARIQRALGGDWPQFRRRMDAAIARVTRTTGAARIEALDRLIDLGLHSDAEAEFRMVLRYARRYEKVNDLKDALEKAASRRPTFFRKGKSASKKAARKPNPAMEGPASGTSIFGELVRGRPTRPSDAALWEKRLADEARARFKAAHSEGALESRGIDFQTDDADDEPAAREMNLRTGNGGSRGVAAEPPPDVAAPRVVNVTVTTPDGALVPGSAPLVARTPYRVRVDIGAVSSGSVVVNPTVVPASLLPPTTIGGWWLKLAAVGHDFGLMAHRWLFLPVSGPAWACSCKPFAAHTCSPTRRRDHVAFDIVSPVRRGDATMRLTLFHHHAVVQSLLLTASVERSAKTPGTISARVDYSLTNRLTDLDTFRPRQLGVMMNRSADGTHTLTFDGARDAPLTLRLPDLQLRDANDMMREALRRVHIEVTGSRPGDRRNRFDADNRKERAAFVEDLRALAANGYTLWTRLLGDQLPTWLRNRRRFVESSGTIHVARKELSTAVFPWALVYDYPIELGAPEQNKLCPLLQEANWRAFADPAAEAPSRCPHEAAHMPNVICPYGFWGFRYQIELPPALGDGQSARRSIPSQPQPLPIVVALSDELNASLLAAHLRSLQASFPTSRFTIHECHTRTEIRDGLGLADLPVAYFYCHGDTASLAGSTGTVPTLRVGTREEIRPEDLVTWRLQNWPDGHWETMSPLVFINGCHTVDTSPQTLVNFVDSFSTSLLAAGVVGTEITLAQPVANEVAATFLGGFQSGLSAGTALQRARGALLKKGNLLGLAYTAYCAADLTLLP